MPSRSLLSALCSICLMSAGAFAQQPEPVPAASKPVEPPPSVRQSALSLVEEALAGTGSLSLSSNRLAIQLRAFPILWIRSEARARALVQQMAGEFAQAANASKQDPDQNPQYVLNQLRDQRNRIARGIASSDAELALLFVSTTQPYLDDDPEDHALITELAAQIALHDPRRALQLAEQQMKESDDLPQSMINLLTEVQRNDAQAGAQLFRDIVDHLKRQNLAEDTEGLSFAASLLGSQFSRQSEAGGADSVLRALAETVVSAALNSSVVRDEPYVLADAADALCTLVPSKAATLHLQDASVAPEPQTSFWQNFNQARSSGDASHTLALLSQVPEDVRPRILQQAAWSLANDGDLETTRQLADRLEPWQRSNVMQQAIRCAALAAGSRGDFAGARQLAAQITDEESRATLLSDIAIFANGNGKHHLAEEMLGEAASLVANRSAGTSAFAAQLRVAQAYLRVKPEDAIPLLHRSASQIEQALSAAAQLDGFLPDRHSFEGSELILNQGFLYSSLLEPYAQATAELASVDLSAARALANRLPLPEARLMTEVFVAAGALNQKDQVQAASNPTGGIRLWLDGRQ
jgi:hypothetical protein